MLAAIIARTFGVRVAPHQMKRIEKVSSAITSSALFLHHIAQLPIHFLLTNRSALVVLLLAPRHTEFQFRAPVFEINRERDQREAALVDFLFKLFDLAPMGQQSSIAPRLVVVDDGRLLVRVDVATVQHELAVVDRRERFVELAEAHAQAFHLATDELNAAFDFRFDEIIVIRLAIFDSRRGVELRLGHPQA